MNSVVDNHIFEDEVRRIARELWPEAQYNGADIVDNRERDGIFETEDCVHLIEATTSRKKDKAVQDVKKMIKIAEAIQKRDKWKAVKCWFVTKDEPTGEQRNIIKRITSNHQNLVNATSFSQFQSKLIDSKSYLNLRDKYPFGSVKDPKDGNINPSIDYIEMDIVESKENKLWKAKEISDNLIDGKRFLILGDYGAGKSMTLRKLFHILRIKHFKNTISSFPLYINLRDHIGQTNAAEIIKRHARNIGFQNPSHLVRAWRAGYIILLIDGVDELTTIGIQGLWRQLKDSRYRAMQGVRELLNGHPDGNGLVLAGREHFFNSKKERQIALGLSHDFKILSLSEFNNEQIKNYLEKSGLSGQIPIWLPTRPLLVGYLAARNLLEDIVTNDNNSHSEHVILDSSKGWDYLLEKVCEREAKIDVGIDGGTVRRILERLSTMSRISQDGLNALYPQEIIDCFKEICGYPPDEKGLLLLQRLPGLGIDRADEETRKFIDEDFADVCRAGDVFQFILSPYDFESNIFVDSECSLNELGVNVTVLMLKNINCTESQINASIDFAYKNNVPNILTSDIARTIINGQWNIINHATIKDALIPSLILDEDLPDTSKLVFHDCLFSKIEITQNLNLKKCPKFTECYFGEVEGRITKEDLPKGIFDDKCDFDIFKGHDKTTKSIIALDLPLGTKVLLTILKKIYQQSGSGRIGKALISGLDHHAKRIFPEILKIAQSENLVISYRAYA